MSVRNILFLLCGAFLFSGCVATGRQATASGQAIEPTVVFRSSDGGYVLSCMQDLKAVRRKKFNAYFATAKAQLQDGSEEDRLRFICLSLNTKANYTQFKQGVKVLRRYIKDHPNRHKEMAALLGLVERLDQVKISHWSDQQKMLDEKEELEGELTALQATSDELHKTIAELENKHEKDLVIIQELRKQIEQLKNIENIIKNREHGS